MVRYFVRVTGEVQGIGYRYFVQRLAQEYDFSGWVRNCPDGAVEMEIQFGEKITQFEKFLARLSEEHPYAVVKSLEKKEITEVPGEKGFRIKATVGDWE